MSMMKNNFEILVSTLVKSTINNEGYKELRLLDSFNRSTQHDI